jgi:hypothetical protein
MRDNVEPTVTLNSFQDPFGLPNGIIKSGSPIAA